ncbi:MAG: GGDEF domain-containing protein [Lachnospiraceae bacterium]|nr:GGDEF domain-containing protein [Lachnospiraceae bacterium]
MNNMVSVRKTVDTAVRSLYQMIMAVDVHTYDCQVIDFNPEIQNISIDSKKTKFDRFCEELYVNIHPEDREGFTAFTDPFWFPKELKTKVYSIYVCRIRHNNRKYYWSEITFCNATEEDGTNGRECLFLIRDIHDWKAKEQRQEAEQRALLEEIIDKYEKLFEENMKDEQTGCYNRKGMKYYSDIILDDARKTGNHLFVCVADLNGLKHMNDTYGHAAGDEAIAVVSAELLKAAPKGSKIVRTGGDEFLLMASISPDSTEPMEMEGKIDKGLEEYNVNHSNPFVIGASYGWVLLPLKDGMTNLDEYIEMADAKMYEMKNKRDKYRRE